MGRHVLEKTRPARRGRCASRVLQPLLLARHRRHGSAADRAGRGPGGASRLRGDGGHRLSRSPARQRGCLPREARNGVRIIRAPGRVQPRRFVGRAANYLTYFASACWSRCGSAAGRRVALTDPPIIGLAALAARPRRRFVFLCQDVFPEVPRSSRTSTARRRSCAGVRDSTPVRHADADRRAWRDDGRAAGRRQGRRPGARWR